MVSPNKLKLIHHMPNLKDNIGDMVRETNCAKTGGQMEAENYMLSQTTKFCKILVVGLYCIFL